MTYLRILRCKNCGGCLRENKTQMGNSQKQPPQFFVLYPHGSFHGFLSFYRAQLGISSFETKTTLSENLDQAYCILGKSKRFFPKYIGGVEKINCFDEQITKHSKVQKSLSKQPIYVQKNGNTLS